MFNTEFTFNTSVGYGSNEATQSVTDTQLNKLLKQDKNLIYKKNITFSFNKSISLKKNKLGFGDIIDFVTKITGIKWLIIKITKGNCGCEKRRQLLNKWLTFTYFYIKIGDPLFDEISIITPDTIDKKNHNNRINTPHQTNVPKKGCGCGRRKL